MRLLWIAALAELASAFYPYHIPTSGGHKSKASRQAIENLQHLQSKRIPSHAFSLPASEEEPTSKTSAQAVERPRSSNHSPLRMLIKRILRPRQNSFNVIDAGDPKQGNSIGIDQDGTDFSYFSAFKFGNSNEEYYLLLDSAASNTWVMAAGCTSNACGVHNILGPSDSSTLSVLDSNFAVSYGTGSVKGNLGTDTLHFSTISVPLTFGLGTTVSDEFSSYPMDGILGLGRPDTITESSNGVNAPSLMDVLISQKVISKKFYGVDLWRDADGGSNDGEINFGAPDTSRYDGDLNYNAAIRNSNGFWEIAIADAGFNGKSAGLTGRSAIIDTGTSFILMPPGDAATLHKLIPGSSQNGQAFTIPCDTNKKVQITFGKTAYDIDPRDYVGKSLGEGGCSSNIVGLQTFGATQWLVGDVFLKNVYAGFDYDGQRVGFGIKGAAGASTPTTTAPPKTTSSTQAPSPTTTPVILTTSTTTVPVPTPTQTTTPTLSTQAMPPPSPTITTEAPPQETTHTSTTAPSPSQSPTQTTQPPAEPRPSEPLSSTTQATSTLTSLDQVETAQAHANGATATDSAFTAGFLPPGSTLTTSASGGSEGTSASGTQATRTGAGMKVKVSRALMLLVVVVCAIAFG
ncbi:acid protease [Tothia fuscella]|uniref:Acid protease n=1 Tax=Tothia fuscella TaxID=1048955 RepID=A0A9P4NK49_9PEZI|nr:acid protease [Tothia fuscella]